MESKFLEIIEQSDNEMAEIKTVKIKIKDKKEAKDKLPKAEKEFKGKKYIARYHICRHGKDGKNRSCKVKILKQVK